MKPSFMLLGAINGALPMTTFPAMGQPQSQANPQTQQQRQTLAPIYGHQLMTAAERAEYHNKMRSFKIVGEREQFRNEHHEQMKARAKKNVTLPDTRPSRGRRDGMGSGKAWVLE
jgi:hypothetical protein